MMKKSAGLLLTILTLVLMMTISVFNVFATDTSYYIEELKMNIDLPEEMVAVTRQSPETDKYYSLFGIDYETSIAEFERENIYLRGMYQDSSKVLNVTMLSDDQSQRIGDYNNLDDNQLVDVENVLLQQESYTSCTIERYDDNIYMNLQYTTEVNGNTVYATQYNTVVEGNYINITLIPANGQQLTAEDYQMLNKVISSVSFSSKNANFFMSLLENPIVMICVCVVAVVGVCVILTIIIRKGKKRRKKAKKAERKEKNQELIQELAQEFSIGANNADYNESYTEEYKEADYSQYESQGEETADDILEQIKREKAKEEAQRTQLYSRPVAETPKEENVDVDSIKVYVGDEVPEETDETVEEESAQSYPVINEEKTVLRLVTNDDEDEDEEYDEYEEDEEEEEEIFGSEESFDQSDDYFDEGLDTDIYSRDTVEDEDEYEEKRPAMNTGVAKEKAKTAGAVVLNGLLIFLNGVKSFFIHLGYFFTNLTRMIKRAYKKHKYQKAQQQKRREQEEARRRRQENLRRKQQRQREMEENGLVKVRSRENVPSSRNQRPRQ